MKYVYYVFVIQHVQVWRSDWFEYQHQIAHVEHLTSKFRGRGFESWFGLLLFLPSRYTQG